MPIITSQESDPRWGFLHGLGAAASPELSIEEMEAFKKDLRELIPQADDAIYGAMRSSRLTTLVEGSLPSLRQRFATTGNYDILGSAGAPVAGSFLHIIFSQKINAAIYVAGAVAKFQAGLTTVPALTACMTGQMNDGTNIYPILNGAKDNVGAPTGPTTTPTAPFVIGARSDGSSSSIVGSMGDVMIFNRALTDAELSNIYLWAKTRWAL